MYGDLGFESRWEGKRQAGGRGRDEEMGRVDVESRVAGFCARLLLSIILGGERKDKRVGRGRRVNGLGKGVQKKGGKRFSKRGAAGQASVDQDGADDGTRAVAEAETASSSRKKQKESKKTTKFQL
jgi:hypothetical protein